MRGRPLRPPRRNRPRPAREPAPASSLRRLVSPLTSNTTPPPPFPRPATETLVRSRTEAIDNGPRAPKRRTHALNRHGSTAATQTNAALSSAPTDAVSSASNPRRPTRTPSSHTSSTACRRDSLMTMIIAIIVLIKLKIIIIE